MELPFPFPQIDTAENDQQNKILVNKQKDLISTFPRAKGWNKFHYLIQYQGFWFSEPFLRGIISVQHQNFQVNSGDIIVASALKTGTTWLKALTYAIVTRKGYDDSTSPLLFKLPHDCIPLLEIDFSQEKKNTRDPEVPLVATHMPYTSLPCSIIQQGCKIVYIWRDAKDTFNSYWHFLDKIYRSNGIEIIPLKEAFELFCQGVTNYGPYWDHVLSYHKARLENPDKILILKYEEMMNATDFYVKKLAEFVGYPFTAEEEVSGELEKMISMCSFEKMSKLEVNKSGEHREDSSIAVGNKVYFRKAEIGDWSNYLTSEMGERLDLIMENKFKGCGLAIASPP